MGSKVKFDRTPGDRFSTSKAYRGIENILLSYDDLVRIGRVKPGKGYAGLQGKESRLSRALEAYQDSLSAIPGFNKYRSLIDSNLEGVQSGDIPDDFRRTITENLRQAQASRGILDSPVAGIEEAVRLSGGSEAVRAARMAELNNYFSGIVGPGLSAFMPSLGAEFNAAQMNNQLAQQGFGNWFSGMNLGVQVGSDIIGAVAAGALGAGGAPAAGMAGTAGAAPVDPWAQAY